MPRRLQSVPVSVRIRATAGAFVSLVVAAIPACGKSQADIDSAINTKIQELLTKRTPQQRAIEAIQTEDADQRRKLLTDVLKSNQATSEWAVKVFASIAKTDPDPQVRCMAIKGLRRASDERVVEPLLMILNQKDFPKVAPAPPEVRWDATEVISYMSDFGSIPVDKRDWARKTLIRLVTEDPDRNVRICAAHGLGNYPSPDALTILVQAVEDRDFAVRYEAERSLEKLTGQRQNYDADAWRTWLAEHGDAITTTRPEGQIEDTAWQNPPAQKNLWERTRDGTRDLFLLWQGERKEGTE